MRFMEGEPTAVLVFNGFDINKQTNKQTAFIGVRPAIADKRPFNISSRPLGPPRPELAVAEFPQSD